MRPHALFPALALVLCATAAYAEHSVMVPGEQAGCPRISSGGFAEVSEPQAQEPAKADKPAQPAAVPPVVIIPREKKKEEPRRWRLEAL